MEAVFKLFIMENVQFIADNEKWLNKRGFSGMTIFKIENDVLTMEFADGRNFSAPINDLQIRRTTGWKLLLQDGRNHTYEFTTPDGRMFKLGGLYSNMDFAGFYKEVTGLKSLIDAFDPVFDIYAVLDNLPNSKRSGLEVFELIMSWGLPLIIFIILAAVLG